MKKIISIFLIISAAALLFALPKSKTANNDYSFSSQDLDGKKISSEIYSNNTVTMINIWGTFCGPCIREMPELAKLNQQNLDKGLQIIGIPIDITDMNGKIIPETKADADFIISKTGVTYKNVIPNSAMLNGFLSNIQAVPTTIFLDKDGNQLGDAVLGARSQKEWQKIIDSLLASQE